MAKKCLLVMAAVLLLVPGNARADWLVTPYAGMTFKGDATNLEHLNYGLSVGFMGAGVAGFEADLGYTPRFFEPKDDTDSSALTGSNNVTSLMANVIIGAPVGGQTGGGIRPYVVGGVGLLKQNVPGVTDFFDASSANDFGFNLGFGAMGFVSDHVGFRGDIRYLRSFQEQQQTGPNVGLGKFDFWRWTVGLTLR
jgi:opacity protein-like surface antigen